MKKVLKFYCSRNCSVLHYLYLLSVEARYLFVAICNFRNKFFIQKIDTKMQTTNIVIYSEIKRIT